MEDGQSVTPEKGLRVLETRIEGESLYMEIASDSREELVGKSRTFAIAQAGADPKFSGWVRAGVEKCSSPIAFDPMDENNDPYAPTPSATTKWHYRQGLRLTRSPI